MKTRIIIFGATGDLMQRKLASALNLLNQEYPSNLSEIYAFGRKDLNDNSYVEFLKKSVDDKLDRNFLDKIHYFKGEFHSLDDFKSFREFIELDDYQNLYYLAIPQELYNLVLTNLHDAKLIRPVDKLLLEKPIGLDLKSAMHIEDVIDSYFHLDQIYRIDHYLAKKQINSILFLRKNNFLIENVLSNKYVKKIEVILNENIDVDKRGAFFDKVGTLVDMGLNHGLSIIAYTLMTLEDQLTPLNIIDSRIDILKTLDIKDSENVLNNNFIAQYEGYKNIEGVDKNSMTETYFRTKLISNSMRWRGVELILESAKALKNRESKLNIYFKDNTKLNLDISQSSNIELDLNYIAKNNLDFEVEKLCFKGCIDTSLEKHYANDYAKIFLEAINSNKSYFLSREEVLQSWKIIEKIKHNWINNNLKMNYYTKFSDDIVSKARLLVN